MSLIFRYNKKSHVWLNKKQILVINQILEKISSRVYNLEETSCLCGQNDDLLIANVDRYGLPLCTVICKKCGLLRTNPRLDSSSLREFYKKEYRDLYMGIEHGDMSAFFDNMVERGKDILSLLKKTLPGIDFRKIEVIEIGCCAGGILLPFLEQGASVKGYDLDQRYLDYGNMRYPALNLSLGGIENLRSDMKRYDLIIVNHALEHLADPRTAIELIESALKTDGFLYVSVPGLRNPAYYFSPTKSFLGSLHIAHLFHFSPLSLTRQLSRFRFLYIDEEIKTICQLRKESLGRDFPSEYIDTLNFIKRYEKGSEWKFKRLKFIIQGQYALAKIILKYKTKI